MDDTNYCPKTKGEGDLLSKTELRTEVIKTHNGTEVISKNPKITLSDRSIPKLAERLKKGQEVYKDNILKLQSFIKQVDDYCTQIPEKDINKVKINSAWSRFAHIREYVKKPLEHFIVVVGDTSSGKSTFCNTLLGSYLLPVSTKPSTKAITEVHYCQKGEERAELHNAETNQWEPISLSTESNPGEKLMEMMQCDENDRSPYDLVKIYWNSPLLESGFVIVDTPGISESCEEVNEKAQRQIEAYLPNAIALFFVINCSVGGFSPRFGHLMRSLATRIDEQKDVKLMFTKESTLFIVNKWDQVINDRRLRGPKVETEALASLEKAIKRHWRRDFDASKLVKLEANAALLALHANTEDPKEFVEFCDKHLTPFMTAIFQLKLSIVAMGAENLLRLYHKTVKIRLIANTLTQKHVQELRKRLDDTKRSFDLKITALQQEALKLIWRVIKDLKEDMKKDQYQLLKTCINEVKQHHHKDITTVHSKFESELRMKIESYCNQWEQNNGKFYEAMKTIKEKAEQSLSPIIKELQTILRTLDAIDPYEIFDFLDILHFFAIVGGIIGLPLGVALVLGIGISGLALGLIAGPVVLSVAAIRNAIKNNYDWKAYNANKDEYLMACGRGAMELLWEKVDEESVNKWFVQGVKNRDKEPGKSKVLLKNEEKARALGFLISLSSMCRADLFINQLNNGINDMYGTAMNLLDSLEDFDFCEPPQATIKQYQRLTQKAEKLLALLGILCLDFTPVGTDGRLSSRVINESAYKVPFARGGYSNVFKGNYTGNAVAIKRYISDKTKSDFISLEHDSNVLRSFRNECIALSQVNHPNLVKYYGWCIDVEEKQNEIVGAQLYLVMELCESDLACRVFGNSQLSVKESIDIALSIASGMQYLHEHGYIHKDLKFDNVLVDECGIIKISDFGVSKKLTEVTGATPSGTLAYMAPEVMNRAYGQPADVYSFGLMLWELWYQKRIYTIHENFVEEMIKGRRPKMPKDNLPPWADLIQCCWKASPVERPVFRDIVLKLQEFRNVNTIQ